MQIETTIRCHVVRLSGEDGLTVTFRSVLSGKEFDVKVDPEAYLRFKDLCLDEEVDLDIWANVDPDPEVTLTEVVLVNHQVVRRRGRTAREAAAALIGRKSGDKPDNG